MFERWVDGCLLKSYLMLVRVIATMTLMALVSASVGFVFMRRALALVMFSVRFVLVYSAALVCASSCKDDPLDSDDRNVS
jgi:hypothetical protein